MDEAYRITIARPSGKGTRRIIKRLVTRDLHGMKVGDTVNLEGQAWTVDKIKREKIIAEFSREGGKLRQIA